MWLGTFEINAVGCLVLGYLFGLMIAKPNLLPENLKYRNNDGVFRRTYHFFYLQFRNFYFHRRPQTTVPHIQSLELPKLSLVKLGIFMSKRSVL